MRVVLLLWLTPSAVFWSWHLLATSDILFAREFHDRVFLLYGRMLGIAPESVPSLFGRAVFSDGLLVLAIFAIRRREAIVAAARTILQRVKSFIRTTAPTGPAHPAE